MSKETSVAPSKERTRRRGFKRTFTLLLIFTLLVQLFPLQAFAAWDGSGSTSGDGASQIVGDFSALGRYGYRFSAYTNT